MMLTFPRLFLEGIAPPTHVLILSLPSQTVEGKCCRTIAKGLNRTSKAWTSGPQRLVRLLPDCPETCGLAVSVSAVIRCLTIQYWAGGGVKGAEAGDPAQQAHCGSVHFVLTWRSSPHVAAGTQSACLFDEACCECSHSCNEFRWVTPLATCFALCMTEVGARRTSSAGSSLPRRDRALEFIPAHWRTLRFLADPPMCSSQLDFRQACPNSDSNKSRCQPLATLIAPHRPARPHATPSAASHL